MVGDVDALQGLYLRGSGRRSSRCSWRPACVGVTAAFLPAAAAVLAAGLLVGGVAVPAAAWRSARGRPRARPPPAAG